MACSYPRCHEQATEHHDCEALGCPEIMRGYHHYWYMHHGAHPVAGCWVCADLTARGLAGPWPAGARIDPLGGP